jgi:hypothetical protein
MPFFSYSAVDAKGKTHQGTLEANNASDAAAAIKKQGMFPTNIAETAAENAKAKGKGFSFKISLGAGGGGTGKVPAKILTVFTRQLATMMKSGVPLLQAFEIVGKGHSNASVQKLLLDIKTEIETGASLKQAFQKHPLYFDALFVNRAEIEKRRMKSQMRDSGPWAEWYVEMAIKTALKYAAGRGVIAFDDSGLQALGNDSDVHIEAVQVQPTGGRAALGVAQPTAPAIAQDVEEYVAADGDRAHVETEGGPS